MAEGSVPAGAAALEQEVQEPVAGGLPLENAEVREDVLWAPASRRLRWVKQRDNSSCSLEIICFSLPGKFITLHL